MMQNKNIILVRKMLGKICRNFFRINDAYWYCNKLAENYDVPLINEPGLRVECNNYSETMQWIKKHHDVFPWIYNSKERELAETFGHIYPALKYHEDIVGYTKIAIKRAYIEDYEDVIVLERDEAFILDTFILPEFRDRHMGNIMLGHVLNELSKKGVIYVFCHIPGWNKASLKLYRNKGFEQISHVWYFRFMNLRHLSCNADILKKKGRRLFDDSP